MFTINYMNICFLFLFEFAFSHRPKRNYELFKQHDNKEIPLPEQYKSNKFIDYYTKVLNDNKSPSIPRELLAFTNKFDACYSKIINILQYFKMIEILDLSDLDFVFNHIKSLLSNALFYLANSKPSLRRALERYLNVIRADLILIQNQIARI